MSSYCPKCGNTGELFDTGSRCDCPIGIGDYDSVNSQCLMLPEQYRGNSFNPDLLPTDLGDYYPKYMEELYQGVSSMSLRNVNIFLSSPTKHGKTFLAYSCMEKLYRKGVGVFPLFDILELKRLMQENDYGKKSKELEELGIELPQLYTVPYLFVKLTTDFSFASFDALKLLLDRRLRRSGGVTIILSDMGWSYVAAADSRKVFSTLIGDGSFGTITNKTFYYKDGDSVDK